MLLSSNPHFLVVSDSLASIQASSVCWQTTPCLPNRDSAFAPIEELGGGISERFWLAASSKRSRSPSRSCLTIFTFFLGQLDILWSLPGPPPLFDSRRGQMQFGANLLSGEQGFGGEARHISPHPVR